MSKPVTVPGIATVKATKAAAPPAWALLERQLIEVMNEGARMKIEKYSERGGVPYYANDLDDLYELIYNWGLFYAIGGSEDVLDLTLQHWNAVTRFTDDSIEGRVHPRFTPSAHKEYYGLAHPGDAEWHHAGEGNMAFYHLGLADPTISENMRRAQRFASYYMDEDPEAKNYDPKLRLLRSPFQTSEGPWHKVGAKEERVHAYLWGGKGTFGGKVNYYGTRSSLYPVVKDLEDDWWKSPGRRAQIIDLFEKIVLHADSPNNLGATGLMTNAYLYTGDEKYKRWVLDYTDAWMDRIRKNNGIVPDNVDLNGKIGGNREGVWWGGIYGWDAYCGFNIMFHSLTIAAECAQLLSGDSGYLELLRSQVHKTVIEHGKFREDGQLLQAVRHNKDGWGYKMWNPVTGLDQPPRIHELTHLYHASQRKDDYELIDYVRSHNPSRDWNENRTDGPDFYAETTEFPRFQYYDGKNPDWPAAMLSAELESAVKVHNEIINDSRTPFQIIEDNRVAPNPVHTKVLTQVALGSPMSVYHGGLVRGVVRYFDLGNRDEGSGTSGNARPGLPDGVATLVDEITGDRVGVQLVNTNRHASRSVIVQAGSFGEHQFTNVEHGEGERRKVQRVDSRYIQVELPPSTSIRLGLGLRRFVNKPSYAFPWHGGKVTAPFQ